MSINQPFTEEETAQFERYQAAMHAMQAGVALEMNTNPMPTTPKHLRVGVNSALVETQMLARLLMDRGIMTRLEYVTRLADQAEEEQARYTTMLQQQYPNATIHLV